MTRHVHLDAVGGVAGDMFVAALLDAMPALRERVLADAAAVLPPEAGRPTLEPGMSSGMRCLRFALEHDGLGDPGSAGCHDHGAAATFTGMREQIEAAPLAPGTAINAVAILRHLAEAEAYIHAVAVEDVHFHEIADWDSLMDVVAAGSIAAALLGMRWSVSDLPRGGGLVKTRHGLLPVPAPATAAILSGFQWRDDGVGGERVTPTGAAILRHLVGAGGGFGGGRLLASGTGAGTRTLDGMPNVLRALVFEAAEDDQPGTSGEADLVDIVSFDVDDMTGEEIGVAADRLRSVTGVLDLAVLSATGKKGRPLQVFRLLVRPEARERVIAECFAETSTIGLRWHQALRRTLVRHGAARDVQGRTVRVKAVERGAGASRKAESDDLAELPGLELRRRVKLRAESEGER